MVSPKTSHTIVQKYIAIPASVAKLEPSSVGTIFKHSSNPHSFFPSIGLFSTEFALGYCNNMHFKRTDVGTFRSNSKQQESKQ